ncbi:metallophosphoesterase [Vagococcus sp. DIV0080]|uniref:Phosphoesterase n=1 Tax=Candidatus Vagococcus giribetii TaxID=2230876 RepID=A0ABS3HQ11_9ENTE|nr:metallophosphoesterase [Vagococcus sp. DIV0080]MBO0475829.1 metallophosphoesterase [Vagococcus sp. DIV0080]
MKYLVVSDNHGNRECLVELVHEWDHQVDAMFHCGDSELKVDDVLWQKFVVVKGNCDYSPDYKNECVIHHGEDTIFMTHGHLFNVNMGLTYISLAAREHQATICLYGHTHKLAAEMVDGVLYLNPGSIAQPRGKYSHYKTYAIIETEKNRVQVTYYSPDHQVIPELSVIFSR